MTVWAASTEADTVALVLCLRYVPPILMPFDFLPVLATVMLPALMVRLPSSLMPILLWGSAAHSGSVHLPPAAVMLMVVGLSSVPMTILPSLCMPREPLPWAVMVMLPPLILMSESAFMALQS